MKAASFASVPEVVKNDLLEELTKAKLDDIAKYVAGQFQMNRRGLPDKDGFVVLPADWASRKIDFQQLALEIPKQHETEGLELPAYHAAGDQWMSLDDLAKVPGLGTSTTDKFGQSMKLGELLTSLKEFGGNGHNDAVMIAVMLLAVACYVSGSRWLGIVALTVSFLIKMTSVLLVPYYAMAWARSQKDWLRFVGIGVGAVATVLAVIVAFYWPWFSRTLSWRGSIPSGPRTLI